MKTIRRLMKSLEKYTLKYQRWYFYKSSGQKKITLYWIKLFANQSTVVSL